MKKLVMALFLAALVAAAPAQGKELLGAQLCGPNGGATQHSNSVLEGPGGAFGGPVAAPAKPGPWFRGYLLAGDHGKVVGKLLFYYVPGADQIVSPGRFGQVTAWTRPEGKLAKIIAALAKRVDPYAAPRLTQVTVNGVVADDPQSYLRLWTLDTKATGYPDGAGSQQVVFFSEPASPWSDGNYVVAYTKSRLLLRDGLLVSLPKDLAAAVGAGRSLDPGRTIPWAAIGLAAVLAVLVLAAAVARRLRPRPAPRPVAQA